MLLSRLFAALFWLACIVTLVFALAPSTPDIPWNPGDKVQHAVAFAVLGILAALAMPRWKLWQLFVCLLAFGGLIEVLQGLTALGRVADFSDFLADALAAGVVLTCVGGVRSKVWSD